jgi:hypothetical protein
MFRCYSSIYAHVSQLFSSFRVYQQMLYTHLIISIRASCTAHLILRDSDKPHLPWFTRAPYPPWFRHVPHPPWFRQTSSSVIHSRASSSVIQTRSLSSMIHTRASSSVIQTRALSSMIHTRASSSVIQTCLTVHDSHALLILRDSDNIKWRKFWSSSLCHFSFPSCYFLIHRSTYPAHHIVPKHSIALNRFFLIQYRINFKCHVTVFRQLSWNRNVSSDCHIVIVQFRKLNYIKQWNIFMDLLLVVIGLGAFAASELDVVFSGYQPR